MGGDAQQFQPFILKRSSHQVIKLPNCMKRLVGIVCCLLSLIASAAWALEKCQSFAAHPDGHEHNENVAHAHNHGLDLPQERSLPGDPVIHCVNPGESPSFISQPSPRISRPLATYKILPSSFVGVDVKAVDWITYSQKRPPGWFLAAVSPYLSLSVLRV